MRIHVSRRRLLQLAAAPAFFARGHAEAQDLDPTVSRVHAGADGRLVYEADEQGNTIHDASHAGYRGGGVAIPTLPVRETVWPINGDNTAHVQAVIDRVSSRMPDAGGFRGAVLLRAGYYRLATPLRIRASGVVLRGEGMGDTGTILVGTGSGQATLVLIGGASGVTTRDDTRQLVTDDYVPVGARSFRVASAAGFRRGDTVVVRRIGNQEWIDAVGMNLDTPGGRWRPFNIEWDRVVADVQGNTITIDAPITCAIEKRWGGGDAVKYDDPGRIDTVGVENLRAVSEFDPTRRTTEYGNMDRQNYVAEEYYADEDHYRNFVVFDNIRNGWVRNATALHFVNSLVGTQRGPKWVTVQDCVSREPA